MISSLTTSTDTDAHPEQGRRLKILLLRVRLLYPLNTGGKIRTARMVEELNKTHDITMVTYRYPGDTDADVERTGQLCRKLVTVPYAESSKKSLKFYGELARNLFEPLPYVVSKYASREMAQAVAEAYEREKPDLIMCDFPQSCEGLRGIPDAPFVLFQHNVEAAIFEQLAKRAKNPVSRWYLGLQARRMHEYEKAVCRKAAHIVAVSDVDKETYAREYGAVHCDVVPTGVDVDFFRPSAAAPKPHHLVFTGSMDWLANQDAILYFASDILPILRKEVPDVTVSVVGRNPPPEIVKLGETEGMEITGTVDDIRSYVHDAAVYVVPLRIGSGTRLKLVEAMAMGKAIVSTTIGAEGLPVEHGRHMVLADEPERFAREVAALLNDPERRAALERNARDLVEANHSWGQVGRIFSDICLRAASK